MNNPFRTIEDYELFLYSLPQEFLLIRSSTITLVRLGVSLARMAGEVFFDNEVRLVVRERILYQRLPVVIDWYGYEVWQGSEKLYWYDPQPHPNDLTLQSTHPHHKHIPPDLKHNRIPAPGLSFVQPNLPMLIREIEALSSEIQLEG